MRPMIQNDTSACYNGGRGEKDEETVRALRRAPAALGCAAAVEEPLSLDINAPRFEGTAKGLDWEFIEPPEGEFYYEVCASAEALLHLQRHAVGTSGMARRWTAAA